MILLFDYLISLFPLSPLASPQNSKEEESPKSQNPLRMKIVMLLILVGALYYYVNMLPSQSSSSSSMKELQSFIVLFGTELYHSIFRLLHAFLDIVSKLDFHYYYAKYMEFFNRMPVVAITLLSVLSILLIIIVLFAVYAFCKFFLFISDSSAEEVELDEAKHPKQPSAKEYILYALLIVE